MALSGDGDAQRYQGTARCWDGDAQGRDNGTTGDRAGPGMGMLRDGALGTGHLGAEPVPG